MRIQRQREAFAYRFAFEDAAPPAMGAPAATPGGLNVTNSAPSRHRPVVLMYGGAFNPPHTGHVGALQNAHKALADAGYNVEHSIVAPTADKLLAKKEMDPSQRLDLQARANITRAAFPKDINGVPIEVETGPSEEVEQAQGKPRRTDLANWAQQRYPNHTIINVTGEDATVPGAPTEPGPNGAVHPSLYSGEVGSNHEGYNYLTLPRDEATGMSSSKIRAAELAGGPIPGMTPQAEQAYRQELAKHRASLQQQQQPMQPVARRRYADEEKLNHYLAQAHRNLMATSRTAKGVVDTSASSDKAKEMSGVSGKEAADLATHNFHRAIKKGYASRHHDFKDPGEVRQFVEALAGTVNAGILAPDAPLVRRADSEKYPYTKTKDLPAAMDHFYSGLHQRLSDPNADPVEAAAYAEYGIDPGHHLFADGCGKASKAVSSAILMRHGMPLPTYPGGRDEYYKHVSRTEPIGPRSFEGDRSYQDFLNYYRSMVPTGGQQKGVRQ